MISVGDKQAVLYRGDQRPASLYRGGNQITGYKLEEQIGTLLSFDGSYNDRIEGLSANGESAQIHTTQGKNLFDKTKIVKLAISETILAGDSYRGYFAECKPNTLYSVRRVSQITNRLAICFTATKPANQVPYSNASLNSYMNVTNSDVVIQATSAADSKYIFVYLSNQADSIPDVMLCEGAISTWEPFVPNSPSPDYPSAITPVTGDIIVSDASETRQTLALTDLNGIAAAGVYDTFEPYVIVDGVPRSRKTQRVSAYTFTGTETISVGVLTNTVQVSFYITGRMPNTPVICTHLMLTQDATDKEHVFGSIASPSVYLHIAKTRLSSFDVAGVKAYLAAQKAAGTPVTVYYALATPVVTLGAPVVIPTYPGQTIISAPAQITAGARVRI